jgi:hypothetical protein
MILPIGSAIDFDAQHCRMIWIRQTSTHHCRQFCCCREYPDVEPATTLHHQNSRQTQVYLPKCMRRLSKAYRMHVQNSKPPSPSHNCHTRYVYRPGVKYIVPRLANVNYCVEMSASPKLSYIRYQVYKLGVRYIKPRLANASHLSVSEEMRIVRLVSKTRKKTNYASSRLEQGRAD